MEPEVIRFSERLGASAQLSQGPGSVKYKVAPLAGLKHHRQDMVTEEFLFVVGLPTLAPPVGHEDDACSVPVRWLQANQLA